MKICLAIFTLILGISTCNKSPITLTKAEQVIIDCINAHGGDRYKDAYFKFEFRDKVYTFKTNRDLYEYTVRFEKDGQTIYDFMSNEEFRRSINGKEAQLSQKEKETYGESLNSVIYFATLPFKLLDDAVIKNYIGETKIKEQNYDIVEITFQEEGGGKDFDDTFHYWINQETKNVDYLAYNYSVNKGGVRFRSAYNKRVIGGVLFQNYVNYKADVGTPLKELPTLWEEGKLKELSKIETENVKNFGKKSLQ